MWLVLGQAPHLNLSCFLIKLSKLKICFDVLVERVIHPHCIQIAYKHEVGLAFASLDLIQTFLKLECPLELVVSQAQTKRFRTAFGMKEKDGIVYGTNADGKQRTGSQISVATFKFNLLSKECGEASFYSNKHFLNLGTFRNMELISRHLLNQVTKNSLAFNFIQAEDVRFLSL